MRIPAAKRRAIAIVLAFTVLIAGVPLQAVAVTQPESSPAATLPGPPPRGAVPAATPASTRSVDLRHAVRARQHTPLADFADTAGYETPNAGLLGAPESVATSTAVDPFAQDRSAHIFTMTDAARVAIYYDGVALVYRVRPAAGTWGSAVVLRGSHTRSVWTRFNDTLYGGSTGTDGNFFFWRLVYSAGAITVASSNPWSGASDGHPAGIYYDAANTLVHVRYLMDWCCGGQTLHAFNPSTLVAIYGTGTPLYQPAGADIDTSIGLAGEGGSTFFYGGVVGTKLTVVRGHCQCRELHGDVRAADPGDRRASDKRRAGVGRGRAPLCGE